VGVRSADSDNGSSASDASDHSLLRRFRSGENDAATELYVRYAKRLMALTRKQTSPAFASRFDAEDVVQSVFRTFFRRVSEGMYDVPPGTELWQLLLIVAIHKIRTLATYHRAKKRDVAKSHGSEELERYSASDDSMPLHILNLVIREIIDEMPESQKNIVELRLQGFQVEEIAVRTNRSKRTIERILQRFRARLSDLIEAE
jgi:RNA polymerase sigma-70 factor (ECF subfamily)